MAFNPFGEDTGVENFSGAGTTEEERKRRLAMLANLASGGTMGDAASLALTSRMNQATDKIGQVGDMIQNPEEAMKQRFITGQPQQVAGPIAPAAQPVQQPQPVAQAPMPVSPQEVQPVQQTQLPQPGPGVQVAGPTQTPPQPQVQAQAQPQTQQVTQPMPSQTPEWHDKLVGGDFNSLSSILANPNTPEDVKSEVQDRMYNLLNDKRMEAQANQTIQKAVSGDPRAVSDLSKELTKRSTEGSILKAMLYSRLGLGELAKDEQNKLGAGTTYQAVVGPNNTRALIKYGADNMPISGFDESGKLISQESLASFAANALPTKSHLMPSVHGTPVQRTNENNETETGLMMYDPRSQQSYVQVGNTRLPTTGWTTMSQTPSSIFEAEKARRGGGGAGEGFDVSAPGAAGSAARIASNLGVNVISGNRTTEAQAALYQQSVDAGTPGILPNGNKVAKPGTSKHETGNAIDIDTKSLTTDQRKALAINGFRQPFPQSDPNHWEYDPSTANKKSPLYVQQAKAAGLKKEEEVVAEARGKEGAKIIAQQGFADNAHPVLTEIESIIKRSTGSGIGAGVDNLAKIIGASTKGQQAIAELQPLAGAMTRMIPRFEGSQSDADVREYKQNSGDFANPNLPVKDRLAALQGMVRLLKIYDKQGNNDWSSFGAATQEKVIDGVTYINDGKGWKKK